MALEMKHVADLMGWRFRIPSYQRGYRWERKQIEQLLNDLWEFNESIARAKDRDYENEEWNDNNPNDKRPTNNAQQMGYYCLQPLAVTAYDGQYDIIDGQQRLTTIYLILSYLSKDGERLPYDSGRTIDESMYELSYQTREESFFNQKKFKESPESAISNIDYYFMAKAYESIGEWFASHPGSQNAILKLLLPDEYKPGNENKRNDRLHDVRFIWYDTPQASSIATFNNLNYGKIGLTASELVKALLFQCDVYEAELRPIAKKDAFARSIKWSLMEEELQNPYFWGMLTNSKYDEDLHLKLVLSFVANDIDSKMRYSESEGWNAEDEDWIFNIFSKALADPNYSSSGNDGDNGPMERIELLWADIQKVYSTLKNWYSDRKLYHQIGLLVHLKTAYEKKSHISVIRDLYEKYRSGAKPDFDEYLKEEIGRCVLIKKTIAYKEIDDDGMEKTVQRTKTISEINYEEDQNEIRKVLLLFNVQLLLEQSSEEARFPFQDVSKLMSLEHIHPQHLNEDKIDFETFKEWFFTRRDVLLSSGKIDSDAMLSAAVSFLETTLATEKDYETNKQQCFENLAVIDKEFDELAEIDPDAMHTLGNMALVDGPTNTALGNKLIFDKRKILKSRSGDSYIPVGTWNAFNKYFSSEIKDMKFWSRADRKAYFDEIVRVYDKYTK